MKRDYVDFFDIPEAHLGIHQRLENWARWQYSPTRSACQPMFRLYRPPAHWGAPSGNAATVDAVDARRVQQCVASLPWPNRLALAWCYVRRNNPGRAARDIGESIDGLASTVAASRSMLLAMGA